MAIVPNGRRSQARTSLFSEVVRDMPIDALAPVELTNSYRLGLVLRISRVVVFSLARRWILTFSIRDAIVEILRASSMELLSISIEYRTIPFEIS